MNLIKDKCIPVKFDDGTIALIAIHEITNLNIIDIASNRADFDCALYQLLIAFLQTFYRILNNKERLKLLKSPPSSNDLQRIFVIYKDYFELFTEVGHPAFMQDLDLMEGEANSISSLLIECPGENALKQNTDHFIKRDFVKGMCSSCAATALFTLQINAPSGGQGHRTGIRGGGPLTTLIKPHNSTLWQKLLMNLIPKKLDYNNLNEVLPWMKPIGCFNTSKVMKKDKNGKNKIDFVTFSTDKGVNKLQIYWSMPRRIRLKKPSNSGFCSICGIKTDYLVTDYIAKNQGINYDGPWEHPLSPHYMPSKKSNNTTNYPLPIKGKFSGIGIKDWLALSFFDSCNSNNQKKCAQVVVNYHQPENKLTKHPVTLWCTAYDMDNMKARCYYDQKIPLVYIDDKDNRIEFISIVNDITKVANEIVKKLLIAIKQALFPPQKSKKTKKRNLTMIEIEFYHLIDPKFYQTTKRIASNIENSDFVTESSKSFLDKTKKTTLNMFNNLAMSSDLDSADLKRIVIARNSLIKDINKTISKFK